MQQTTLKRISGVAMITGLTFLPVAPAHAQIAQLTSAMNWLQVTLASVSVVATIVAIFLVAYQMLVHKTRLENLMNIILAGVLFGGAPAIAAILVGGTGS